MTLRELAKRLKKKIDRWPDWKKAAAMRGLFTEGTK